MVLEESKTHQLARAAVEQFGGPAQSFTPINQIHRAITLPVLSPLSLIPSEILQNI